MTHQVDSSNRWRRGYTLLEVLLALLISGLIMVAIGYAIDLHLRLLDSGRGEVEDAQLARALLSRMANDLRNGVRYEKVDTSGILSVAGLSAAASLSKSTSTSNSSSGGSSSGGSSGGGSSTGGSSRSGSSSGSSGTSNSGGSSSSGTTSSQASSALSQASGAGGSSSTNDTSSSSSSSSDAASVVVPGLYGTATDLQIDTSRLPRVDQYGGAFAPGTLAPDVVSDLKTVSYYVIDPLTAPIGQGGLVRREWDRAATRYATDLGSADTLRTRDQVLAPEALSVAFRYYDGTEWVDVWDSTDRQGLPLAVEILLSLWPSRGGEYQAASGRVTQVEPRQYRLLVHLVAAEPTTASAADAETSSTSDSTTSSSSGSSTSTSSGSGS